MVWKRCKANINTGGTIKNYTSYLTKVRQHATSCYITKYFLRRKNTDKENETICKEIEDVVGIQDGGMESRYCMERHHTSKLFYSLNKRKRWMFLQPLIDAVDSCDVDNSWKIVLQECLLQLGKQNYGRNGCSNTTALHDSSLPQRHNYARAHLSYFTNLHKKGRQIISDNGIKANKTARKKFRNRRLRRSRGVQRSHVENCMNCQNQKEKEMSNDDEQNNFEFHRQQHRRPIETMLGTDPGLPELRYEVYVPMKQTSEKSSYVHYGSKKWSYWRKPSKKAHCKMPHLRVKQHESFYWNGMKKWDRSDEEERVHNRDWQSDNLEVYDHEIDKDASCSEYNSPNTSIEVCLEDFLKPLDCSKFKKRKHSCDSGLLFVHPNKASSRLCVPHPKGSAIYETVCEAKSESADEFSSDEEINVTDSSANGADVMNDHETGFLLNRHWTVLYLKKSDYDSIMNFNFALYSNIQLKVWNSNSVPQTHSLDLEPVIGLKTESLMNNRDRKEDMPAIVHMWIQKNFIKIIDWPDVTEEPSESVRMLIVSDSNSISDKLSCLQTELSVSRRVFTVSAIIDMIRDVIDESAPKTTRGTRMHVKQMIPDDLTTKICGHQVDVCSVTDAYMKTIQNHYSKSLPAAKQYGDVMCSNEQTICEICLCETTELQNDSTGYMIQLLPCQHSFCVSCWSNHILQRIRIGDVNITCQAFKCDSIIDKVTIMTVVPLSMYIQWERRKKEKHLESTEQWKYCPNPNCTKIVRISKTGNITKHCSIPVRCECGEKWCYSCEKQSHWPASCQQASTYLKMLKQNGDEFGRSPLGGAVTIFVQVKKCPECKYPMEKSGGCAHMTCKCGHGFCWECLGDWREHIGYGLVCPTGKVHEKTVELETSFSYPLPTLYYKSSVVHRYKWKSLKLSNPKISTTLKSCLHYLYDEPYNKYMDTTSNKNLASLVIFMIQLHKILEYLYVLLSNMTKSTTDTQFRDIVSQLAFIVERIEEITGKRKPRSCDIERGKMLRSIAEKSLILLAKRVNKLQEGITRVQQRILLKKTDSLKIYK